MKGAYKKIKQKRFMGLKRLEPFDLNLLRHPIYQEVPKSGQFLVCYSGTFHIQGAKMILISLSMIQM